ncbi:hypothetical protein FGO68_gene3295 [Halteria grandinella]|uniref:Uncharacterized protein n=1 Tax=Halteria grandinella TaxID=5974 RepID=A0A8J8NYL3_HALGN|nr:hypothetical protein FGO68_gene3295 [Halteria grandinella]
MRNLRNFICFVSNVKQKCLNLRKENIIDKTQQSQFNFQEFLLQKSFLAIQAISSMDILIGLIENKKTAFVTMGPRTQYQIYQQIASWESLILLFLKMENSNAQNLEVLTIMVIYYNLAFSKIRDAQSSSKCAL